MRAPIFVSSRASVPERPEMWRKLRESGWNIVSTWIDEAGDQETADFTELWSRIEDEIRHSEGVILYAEESDFPLKGALIEVGMALGMGKRVALVLPECNIDSKSLRPIGSWIKHPRCERLATVQHGYDWIDVGAGQFPSTFQLELPEHFQPLIEATAIIDQLQAWIENHEGLSETPIAHLSAHANGDALEILIGDWCLWSDQCDSSDDMTFEYCQEEFFKRLDSLMPFMQIPKGE